MEIVIKPVKKPPRFNESEFLSLAARDTIKALEHKYNAFFASMSSASACPRNPADYYKRIYENTFKKEIMSQPRTEHEESTHHNYSWKRTHFKNSSVDNSIITGAQESYSFSRSKQTDEKRIPRFDPRMKVGNFFDSSSSLQGDNCIVMALEHSHTAEEQLSPTTCQLETRHLDHKLPDTDSKAILLRKWNRKFSQLANQLEDKQEAIASRNEIRPLDSSKSWECSQVNPELMWIDDLNSQPERNCSDSEVTTFSSPLAKHCHQTDSGVLSSEDPFSVFSLRETDHVDEKEQSIPETPSISLHSQIRSDGVECLPNNYLAKPPKSEEPTDIDKTTDLLSSSENDRAMLFETANPSEKTIGSFANRSLQNINCNLDRRDKKESNVHVEGMLVSVDLMKKQRKRKANEEKSDIRMPKKDPLSEYRSYKADLGKGEKRLDDEKATQAFVKKFKPGFKPPTKGQPDTSTKIRETNISRGKKIKTVQSLKDAQSGLQNLVDYFTLSTEKRREVTAEMKSTQHVSLTIVMSTGKSIINVFDSEVDYTKEPCVVVLTAEGNCYQLTVNADTMQDAKVLLMQILCKVDCETIVPNSKEFLSSLYKILHLDIKNLICCETLEDPVLASWLLNPDKPPANFTMMCQTAHLKFNEAENDWLSCLCFVKKLMNSLKKRLEGDSLLKLYKDIEMRLVPLLAYMENQFLKVNIEVFRKFADILKSKLHKLEESAYKEVGHKFVLNSHPQLRQILYEELKLDEKLPPTSKIGKTSVSHHKSTCESSLLLLAGLHSLPTIVLEYRSLQKLKSTYIDGMLSCLSNNSISTHWDQTSAATGRITSYQPNIQNIPKAVVVVEDYLPNTMLGSAPKSSAEIYAREPFICHDGFVFLAADFQQIELRILAHLSDDKALLSMFWNPDGMDVFSLLTAEWKSIEVDKVSNEERETTKRIVYSIMYGVGKDKLAVYLKVKPDIAKEIMKNFLARFPAIDSFTKKCCSYAKEYGYTETICGRKRYFPYINSSSPALRAQAQRQAVNFCVQGSAADICKLAMLEVESNLKKHPELNYRLLLQIHDELLWEVAEDQLLQVKEIIERVMENGKLLCQKFCSIQVPLTVSFSRGQSWAHLTPFNEVNSNEV